MIKSEDISKIKELGYNYITSIGKPSIRKLINDQDSQIQAELFDEELKEVVDEQNEVRYILRRNPTRCDEIRQTRDAKITKLNTFIQSKVEYYNTHYQAKKQTLQNAITSKIGSFNLASFVSYTITYTQGECATIDKDGNTTIKTKDLATVEIIVDQVKLNKIEELDGCYVVKTSLLDLTKDTKEDIHKVYKTLSKVENAFKQSF